VTTTAAIKVWLIKLCRFVPESKSKDSSDEEAAQAQEEQPEPLVIEDPNAVVRRLIIMIVFIFPKLNYALD
jgi:hypothetical protein